MDKLKKILSLTFIFICIISTTSVMAEMVRIVDDADLLNSVQQKALEETLAEFVEEYDYDFVIHSTNLAGGASVKQAAKSFFSDNDYGIGDEKEGFIFLIDMNNREFWYQTFGDDLVDEFSPYIDFITEEVTPYLKDAKYEMAFLKVVELTEEILEGEHKGERDRSLITNLSFMDKLTYNLTVPWFYIIPLVIAIIVVVLVTISSKGKRDVTARTYESDNTFKVNNRVDQFLHETVTRTKIQSSNSSGGGGGGGGNGGGGGGSF